MHIAQYYLIECLTIFTIKLHSELTAHKLMARKKHTTLPFSDDSRASTASRFTDTDGLILDYPNPYHQL